jgi:hypothetical protein
LRTDSLPVRPKWQAFTAQTPVFCAYRPLSLGVWAVAIRHLGEDPDADDRKRDQATDVGRQPDRPEDDEGAHAERGCQEDPHSDAGV